MAVLTCKRRDDLSGKKDENSKGYKETFIVTVEAGDEPAVILNSNLSSIPQIGDPHPVDTTATVRNLNVKHTKNRQTYILDVMYDDRIDAEDSGNNGGGGGDTGLQVLQINGGVWYETYIAEQDVNNKAYINTAGDKIEVEHTRPHPQFTIISRSKQYLVPKFIVLTNQVNKFAYSILGLSFPPKTLLFDEFNFQSLDNGFWEYTFRFKARYVDPPDNYDSRKEGAQGDQREGGWVNYILNAGYREKINGVLKAIKVKDDQGKRTGDFVSSPWPLDKDGLALERKDFKDKAIWLDFEEHQSTSFRVFRWNWRQLVDDAAQGQDFFNQ